MADWLTVDDTEGLDTYWPENPTVVGGDNEESYRHLAMLLTVAREQCEAFAPKVAEGAVPERYRVAQALQARALDRAGLAGTGDRIGPDGTTVTVYPMDWTVKSLLRPRRLGRIR